MPNGMHGMMTKQTWGEMYIRADQQVNIKAAHFLGGAEHCDATVYFKPEKDKDYEFTIDLVDNVCVMSPRDITGGEVITLQVSKRKLSCKRDETAKTRKSADPRIVKAIKLKGGSCVFHELDMNPRIVPEGMKEGEKAFTLGLKCTLKRGTDLLEKSKFIAPDGQQYNAGGLTVRDENGSSIYEFSFSVPEDVDVKKLKYVYGNQMLLLDK